MRVKQRLQFNAALSVVAAAAVLLVLVIATYRVILAVEASDMAGEIITGAFERVTLRNDYVQSGSERAKVQWYPKHEEIGRRLKSAAEKFRDPADQRVIAEMSADQESIGRIFSAIVKNREQGKDPAHPGALSLETEERLLTQLNMRIYGLVLQARGLQESSRAALFSTLRLAVWGIAGVLVLVMAALIGNSLTMGRSITERIRRLRDGAATIGEGELDHRIDIKGEDELAELSGAFNAMTAKLHASYRELENEIKERCRVEEELRRQRERFKVTLASIGDAVVATDEAGRITFLNPVAGALTGWQPGESLGRPVQEVFRIFNEESREPGEDIVARVLREGAIVTLANNTALASRDGREIPIEDSAAPIRSSEGTIVGVVLVFHDVTEKRRARQALQESEERYRTLFETMTEGFALHEIICDDAGRPCDYRFQEVNPAFERQTGWKAAEIVGRTLYEVLPQAESLWVERYGAVALTGEPVRFDQWSAALGRYYEVSAFRTDPGRFAVMFLDITDRKRAEQALAEHAAKLEESNRELESFSYSVSHDLRAPLRAIGGFAQMILKKEGERFDGETRRRFEVIRHNAEMMGRLIDDLLAFSRLGRQAVARVDLDMGELVREAWGELVTIDPGRAMTLEMEAMPAASGDRSLIRQVYGNLLGNAVKFTQGREAAVIEVGSYVRGGETVYYVRDNGVGFDMQFYDKLFGVFQRLHNEDEYKGTGIGLALVQRIVKRHGGRVWAEGKVGEGACFSFTLPK